MFSLSICISLACNTSYSEGLCNSEIRFLNNIVACLPEQQPSNTKSHLRKVPTNSPSAPKTLSQIYCVHNITGYSVLHVEFDEEESHVQEITLQQSAHIQV